MARESTPTAAGIISHYGWWALPPTKRDPFKCCSPECRGLKQAVRTYASSPPVKRSLRSYPNTNHSSESKAIVNHAFLYLKVSVMFPHSLLSWCTSSPKSVLICFNPQAFQTCMWIYSPLQIQQIAKIWSEGEIVPTHSQPIEQSYRSTWHGSDCSSVP